MPVFDFDYRTPNLGLHETLLRDGPIIAVEIGVPAALEAWCHSQSIPTPGVVYGFALIDTGAAVSAVHEGVLTELGIAPIDSVPVSTPSGDSDMFVYPARVSFPGLDVTPHALSTFAGCQLDWMTPDGKNVVMLLGRDVLAEFLMVYNGKTGAITVAY